MVIILLAGDVVHHRFIVLTKGGRSVRGRPINIESTEGSHASFQLLQFSTQSFSLFFNFLGFSGKPFNFFVVHLVDDLVGEDVFQRTK